MELSTPAGTRRWAAGSAVAAVAFSVVAIAMVPATVNRIWSSSFLPHAYCYLYDRKLIALHIGSDAVIWISYVAIAVTLAYLVRRTRREIPFSWMFLAFGTFIIACGFTHFMEMVVLWKPLYWLAGDIKLITAVASVVTAVALPPLVPQVHEMIRAATVSEQRGQLLERTNAEMRHLSARLLSTQDNERRRIARELHDGVGQYLTAIKMSFDAALSSDRASAESQASLADCQRLLEHCTTEIRTLSHLLHPPLLEEMGLASAVPWDVQGFRERSGINVELEVPSKFGRLSEDVEIALFRVLQEGLTNVHRHSGSKVARIRLEITSNAAILTIQDQGRGLPPAAAPNPGVGIAGMRERVWELGGEFKMTSASSGTTILASIPLQGKRREQVSGAPV